MIEYLRYRDDLERIAPDEAETFQRIADVMLEGQHKVRAKTGTSLRISHAKAHAFLKGTLTVLPGLPPELAQGLFAQAGEHPVLVRLSQAPGEPFDDRAISTPRGMAMKVFNVEGEKLTEHAGARTQDFVLDTGTTFVVGSAKAFLGFIMPNALVAPHLPEAVKGAVSTAARVANEALQAVGVEAATFDTMGHPKYHPMGEDYYSQAAIRYGDYVAKIAVRPSHPALSALFHQHLAIGDADGLRTATREYFQTHPAEFAVEVQLAVDEARTPVEDPTVAWPESLTPYRTVARLVLPPQEAYAAARQDFVDGQLSFAPVHALAAHRPLGSVMRARMFVYPRLAAKRREENGQPQVEPASLDEVP